MCAFGQKGRCLTVVRRCGMSWQKVRPRLDTGTLSFHPLSRLDAAPHAAMGAHSGQAVAPVHCKGRGQRTHTPHRRVAWRVNHRHVGRESRALSQGKPARPHRAPANWAV